MVLDLVLVREYYLVIIFVVVFFVFSGKRYHYFVLVIRYYYIDRLFIILFQTKNAVIILVLQKVSHQFYLNQEFVEGRVFVFITIRERGDDLAVAVYLYLSSTAVPPFYIMCVKFLFRTHNRKPPRIG